MTNQFASHNVRRTFMRLAIFALILGILTLIALGWASRWRPDRTIWPLQGVTLSASNGAIHWGRLKAAGVDFAYLEATIGAKARDARFLANRDGARSSGMRYGAVHRFSLCELATAQAANFDRLVPRDSNALPPAVAIYYAEDCTDRPTQAMLESELTTFLAQVESHVGRRAILAPSSDVAADYSFTDLKRPLWIARSFRTPEEGTIWRMWQASNHAHVDGADGQVRWNVINPQK